MFKKKLLNEAQIRRFMGLAGMQSNLVSNYLNETDIKEEEAYEEALEKPTTDEGMATHYEQDEDPADEEPELDLPEPAEEPEPEMDMPASEGEADVDETAIKKVAEMWPQLQAVMQSLADAAGVELGGAEMDMPEPAMEPEMEPEMDMPEPAEEPEMDMPEPAEEPEEEEVLNETETETELTEEEVIQEVARRVAARILKAKKAHDNLEQALGKKKKN